MSVGSHSTISIAPAMWRRSFLRAHIAGSRRAAVDVAGESGGFTAIDPIPDILALGALRCRVRDALLATQRHPKNRQRRSRSEGLPDELRQQLWKFTTPDVFFGFVSPGDKADYRLYCPVPVFIQSDVSGLNREWPHLSALLKGLAELTAASTATRGRERRGYGVLLHSGSGSGKTVACWKAWYDCFLPEPDTPQPLLAECVPCWIRKTDHLNDLLPVLERDQQAATCDSILLLLGYAAGLIQDVAPRASRIDGGNLNATLRRIRRYCDYGPRLLLFIDLNHFGDAVRKKLALALRHFQYEHRDRHCCVVTYRSALRDDQTLRNLNSEGDFLRCDLDPLTPTNATAYLSNFRNFERHLFQQFPELTLPERDIVDECRRLEELIARTVRGGESLISTPLLMHWVAELDPGQISQTHNLTHLYRHVVDQHVKRELGIPADENSLGRSSSRTGAPNYEDQMIAMVRIALLIQAQGQQYRVPLDNALAALKTPEGDRPQAGQKKRSWWPSDPFWWQQEDGPTRMGLFPYYLKAFKVGSKLNRLLECGLFRRDGDQLGFIHDSLVPYFSGSVALREYHGPRDPDWRQNLPGQWVNHAFHRIMETPTQWVEAVEFLVGALEPLSDENAPDEPIWFLDEEQMQGCLIVMLVQAFVLAPPTSEMVSLTWRAARGAARITVLDFVTRAIEERLGELIREPRALPQVIQHFMKRIESSVDESDTDELYASEPARRARAAALFEWFLRQRHDGWKLSNTLWFQLHAVSRGGAVTPKHTLPDNCSSLVVTTSGDVFTGTQTGELFWWKPTLGISKSVGRHSRENETAVSEICAVAVGPDGTVYTGDASGESCLWEQLESEPEPKFADSVALCRMKSEVRLMVPLLEQRVALLDDNGSLQIVSTGDNAPIEQERRDVNEGQKGLLHLPSGSVLTSREDSLRIWTPEYGSLETLFDVKFTIQGLAAAGRGIVVWRDGKPSPVTLWCDGKVRTWSMDEYVKAARPMEDGSIVVVCSNKILRLTDEGDTLLYPQHRADGRRAYAYIEAYWFNGDLLLLGDEFRLVAIPLSDQVASQLQESGTPATIGKPQVLFELESNSISITKVVACPGTGIVSCWDKGAVRITDLRTGATKMAFRAKLPDGVESVLPGPPGKLLVRTNDEVGVLNVQTGVWTRLACPDFSFGGTGIDSRDRIYIADTQRVWRLSDEGTSAELLVDLENRVHSSIEAMHVSSQGTVLLAAGLKVLKWSKSRRAEASGERIPHLIIRNVAGLSGVLNTGSGVIRIDVPRKIMVLLRDDASRSVLAGCDTGELFRWSLDRLSSNFVCRPEKLLELPDGITHLTSASNGDLWIATKGKTAQKRDQYRLTGILSGQLLTSPLLDGQHEIQHLSVRDDGSPFVVLDANGTLTVQSWKHERSDSGETTFHPVTILEDEGKSASLIASNGNLLVFRDGYDDATLRAVDVSRPVFTIPHTKGELYGHAIGSAWDDMLLIDGPRVRRLIPGEPPVDLFELESVARREGAVPQPPRIVHAVKDGKGNIVVASTSGRLEYWSAETAEIRTIRPAVIDKYGSVDCPSDDKWHIGVDPAGSVVEWCQFCHDEKRWQLSVWEDREAESLPVFSFKTDHWEYVSGAAAILHNGDLLFATSRDLDPSNWDDIQMVSQIRRLRGDDYSELEVVCEIEWKRHVDRLTIQSIAEWTDGRLLLGFEDGRIGVVHPEKSRTEVIWLARRHHTGSVRWLKPLNATYFASASYNLLQVGTSDEVLLRYQSDDGIGQVALITGNPPGFFLREGTGTLLRVVGDASRLMPDGESQ